MKEKEGSMMKVRSSPVSSGGTHYLAELPAADYAPAVQQILGLAQEEASRHQATQVEPEHVLLGLLSAKENAATQALVALQVDPSQLRQEVEAHLPPVQESATSALPLSEETRLALWDAVKEAKHLGHSRVSAEHLLLGLLYMEQGIAQDALVGAGVSLYEVRQYVLSDTSGQRRKIHRRTIEADFRPSYTFISLVVVMLASGLGLLFVHTPTLVSPLTVMFVLSGWIISVCLHEFGHALAAYMGGDWSVRNSGYLTLDPLVYTNPVMSILLPIVFLLMGGLGLPGGAVYINRRALRSWMWESIVSAAGPLGTLLFGLLVLSPFWLRLAEINEQNLPFWAALAMLGFLQISALLFNLIPIPPLDGFGIVAPYLPNNVVDWSYRHSRLLFILLLIMMWNSELASVFWQQVFSIADAAGVPLELIGFGLDAFLFWR